MSIFEKVLQDYSAIGGGHLSLTPVVGEAFLDRHLVERIALCKNYPLVRGLSFDTNAAMAHLLDDEKLAFVLSRMRRVYVSVYGLDEAEHREMTRKVAYQQMIRGIERILRFSPNEVVFGFRLLKRREPDAANRWLEGIAGYRESKAVITVQSPVYSYSNWGVFDITSALPGDAT